MARIPEMPPITVIWRLRGVIDFACWKGINYARKWPRRPRLPRTISVQAAGFIFAQFSRALAWTAPEILAQAKLWVKGTKWTWKDLLTSAGYGNLIQPY